MTTFNVDISLTVRRNEDFAPVVLIMNGATYFALFLGLVKVFLAYTKTAYNLKGRMYRQAYNLSESVESLYWSLDSLILSVSGCISKTFVSVMVFLLTPIVHKAVKGVIVT